MSNERGEEVEAIFRVIRAGLDGWTGVDLDGTLAEYDGWKGLNHIGPPVPRMLDRVRGWLDQGVAVKIVTARANEGESAKAPIRAWCREHLGQELEITASKDFKMAELWDDRAVRVQKNTGVRMDQLQRENTHGD